MRNPFRWPGRDAPGTSSLIVVVLIGSIVVAAVLAMQAIVAARERRAISEAMLRQYAELAAWEFSRQARRDIEQSLVRTLATYAHPQRSHAGGENCNCEALAGVEWFEVTGAGEVKTGSEVVRTSLGALAGHGPPRDAGAEGLRTIAVSGDRTRFIAMKSEPHLDGGGQVGLVASARSLQPMLASSYGRASLLPAALTGGRDARTLVDLRVFDATGATVFASRGTAPGPQIVETQLLAGLDIPLKAQVSVTPAFIASLGPAHGAPPRTTLVVALVTVNVVLVTIGLLQLTRERELARLRSNFVAGVSHELRTPLAQIRMFSETLLLDRIRNATEKQRALEIIGQESTRLTQLVDNVLLFHRRTEASVAAERDAIDLNAFARDVVDSFEPLAAARSAALALAVSPEAVSVRADRDALRQVLLNLLDNAVKFGPAGQVITVRVAAEAGQAVVTVDDGGPGVPIGERERIFKAFERGRATKGTGGAGIGLAVVQQIVDAHRGEVSVEGLPAGGARFRVVLPMATLTAVGVPAAVAR
jgi:signal transduction histidine kinase